MRNFDDIIGLCDETAEMLSVDDEDHQLIVKGETEIVDRLATASAAIDASLKDDLLLIQEHKGESQIFFEEIAEKKRKVEERISGASEAKSADETQVMKNKEKIEEMKTEREELNNHAKKLGEEGNLLKEKLRKEMAVAKSKLRIYSTVTGIEWDLEAASGGGGGGGDFIAGVFTGQTKSAPFQFDKKRKSSYEITNALWDLIDDGEDDGLW